MTGPQAAVALFALHARLVYEAAARLASPASR